MTPSMSVTPNAVDFVETKTGNLSMIMETNLQSNPDVILLTGLLLAHNVVNRCRKKGLGLKNRKDAVWMVACVAPKPACAFQH